MGKACWILDRMVELAGWIDWIGCLWVGMVWLDGLIRLDGLAGGVWLDWFEWVGCLDRIVGK